MAYVVRKTATLTAVLAAAVMGLGAGVAVAAGSGGLNDQGAGAASSNATTLDSFPVNEEGQTYGSALNASSVDTEPDLILVVSSDGSPAYVKKSDLDRATGEEAAQNFASREEALAWQASRGDADVSLPIYTQEGDRRTGTFVVEGDGS